MSGINKTQVILKPRPSSSSTRSSSCSSVSSDSDEETSYPGKYLAIFVFGGILAALAIGGFVWSFFCASKKSSKGNEASLQQPSATNSARNHPANERYGLKTIQLTKPLRKDDNDWNSSGRDYARLAAKFADFDKDNWGVVSIMLTNSDKLSVHDWHVSSRTYKNGGSSRSIGGSTLWNAPMEEGIEGLTKDIGENEDILEHRYMVLFDAYDRQNWVKDGKKKEVFQQLVRWAVQQHGDVALYGTPDCDPELKKAFLDAGGRIFFEVAAPEAEEKSSEQY